MAVTTDITTKLNNYLQTSQHRSYFLVLITVIFIIVMVMFGILPAYSSFTLQGAENAKRQAAIDQLTAKLSALKKLTGESQSKPELIEYFDSIFPGTPEQESVIKEIIDTANKNSVYLDNLDFKENSELSREFVDLTLTPLSFNVKSLILSFNVEGSQQTLISFIRSLEEKRKIYNLKSINIVRKGEDDLPRISPDKYYTLTMNVNIYYFDESATPPVL